MIGEKKSKKRLGRVIFGLFFALMALVGLVGPVGETAYADPADESGGTSQTTTGLTGDACQSSLGAIGWLVCPTTGAIAQGVDFLYGLIKDFLVIDPVEMEDGSPIYEIWKYFRGVTNIVFIIFLLVVIYSQITGLGISNYGVKKALPKLIVAAVLVNLSFLICSLAVDLSNVIGTSLKGLFDTIASSAVVADGGATAAEMDLKNAELFNAMAGGTALTIAGGAIAFETGAVWMMIPLLLGAIVAVVTGLITIALRQAVVALLIMISPLAVVAYMLPNTENLFKQWKKLLTQMLVFYPMFSLLFGAANLAGFAIILSAKDGFGVMLGMAVQIFPLFFSWKLMQMSGTFLGTVNAKMQSMAARPLAGSRAWADSRRLATKQRRLAEGRPTTPSLRLMQFMANRRIARDAETAENADLVKKRGLAYRAGRNYDRRGVPTKQGEEAYESIRRGLEYQQILDRDENNMNKGLGQLAAVTNMEAQATTTAERAKARAKKARLDKLDDKMVDASDALKFEQARGEKITADNARGFYKRAEAAINAHMDDVHGGLMDEKGKVIYRTHDLTDGERADAAMRYDKMREVMEGDVVGTHFAAASAAHAYDTQNKIVSNKFQKYFDLAPPTKDVLTRVRELSTYAKKDKDGVFEVKAADNIDAIVAGMKVLNQRGDTDLVRKVVGDLTNEEYGGLELGTHASQSLASFLMFDVGNGDPYLRRFGKYINLETARAYNKNERKVMHVNYDEYVKGYHEGEPDLVSAENPTGRMYAKKGMVKLLEGTSFDGIERVAMDSITDGLMEAYGYKENINGDPVGPWDVKGWIDKNKEVRKAISPQFISASLKYLSGSEQIGGAVKFLTGYKTDEEEYTDENGQKQKRNKYVPTWESKKFAGYEKEVRALYRAEVMKWIKDQTGGQILNMRSDYKEPVWEHLFEAYFDEDPDDMFGEAIDREEFEKMRAEIQTRYGDLDPEIAKTKREEDVRELKNRLGAAELRKRLGDNGVLDRIQKLSRTSASSGTKSWMNEALLVEEEDRLRDEIGFYKTKRKERHDARYRDNDDSGVDSAASRVYDEGDVRFNLAKLDEYWNSNGATSETRDFYDGLIDLIRERLGENSFIEEEFNRRYGRDGGLDDVDNLDLYDFAKDCFGDLRQY